MKFSLKSLVSIFISFVMIISTVAIADFAVFADVEQIFDYTIDDNTQYVTITGYNGTGAVVNIPEQIENLPVRYIGEYSFMQNKNITNVTLPDTVRAIDQYAFFDCTSLQMVSFGYGVKYIGTSAFNNCTSLQVADLPSTIMYIDNHAFYNCTNLTEYKFGGRIQYIGEYAIGYYGTATIREYDTETWWALYDETNNVMTNISISGYDNTGLTDYIASSDFGNITNSYGNANVNDIGDLNGDGVIDIKDATVIQKMIVGMVDSNSVEFIVSDIDDDNNITSQDSTAIQKYIAGIVTQLGANNEYDIPCSSTNADDYDTLPTVKLYDVDDTNKANQYTISQVINSVSSVAAKDIYKSTARIQIEGLPDKNEGEVVECYTEVKVQGNSSVSYSKKNFTLKFYKDVAQTDKDKKKIVNAWGKESKYVLKANYIDHTHARNVVGAKIWGQLVKSRQNVNSNLANLVNGGAIDGFPVKLYINDTYVGLYTFNIPKDNWLYGMSSKSTVNQAVIIGEQHTGAAAFQKSFNTDDFSIEYATNELDTEWIATTFNRFYNFVATSSDSDFKAHISEYSDIEAILDYFIFVHTICAMDCWEKNLILVTYDAGEHWIPSVYDMDTTFGIHWTGEYFYNSETMMDISGRTSSVLWQRIAKLYKQELGQRYKELRQTSLSLSNIITMFEDFVSPIPNGLYKLDYTPPTGNGYGVSDSSNDKYNYYDPWNYNKYSKKQNYYNIPQTDCSNVNQIVTFMAQRFEHLDQAYGYSDGTYTYK